MTPLDLAKAFLAKGREDERALDMGMADRRMSDAIFGFHAQQAVEKYLKAVLAIDQERPERTHDLVVLADQCGQAGHAMSQENFQGIADLSRYAVQERYPLAVAPPIDRRRALDLVIKVRQWAEQTVETGTE